MDYLNCAIIHSVLYAYPEKLTSRESKQYMEDKGEE